MSQSIQQHIETLRAELNRHNFLYYVQAAPEISDREYDALLKQLIDLEARHPELVTADSPTQRVGGEPIVGFATVTHARPMMSIDNTYDEAEVRAFDERVRKGLGDGAVQYVAEPKVDGVAASIRYENGVLVLGATRGDGRRGDDVTHNVRTMASIPLRLRDGGTKVPEVLEVRGEIYMPNAEFQRLNKQREEAGEPLFANPRNATAGTLKQLDPKIVAQRKLRFVSHGFGEIRPLPCDNYWDCQKLVQSWGLPIGENMQVCRSIDDVIRVIEEFAKVRGKLAYQTDGMVIKVNAFGQRDQLGATSKAPRWVIAFKYEAERVSTLLEGVTWQIGKGGSITPVAELAPVFVAGSTVRRATLHNIDQVRKLDLHESDIVVIEKAGEVIPHVVQVDVDKRPASAKRIIAPTLCPSCGKAIHREEGEAAIRCINPKCPAQRYERLVWFAGRKQMNIEGLGERIIEQLIEAGVLTTYADFFRLRADQIAPLTREVKHRAKVVIQRTGEKTAEKIVASIAKARLRGLSSVLAGLGIRHVGSTVAQKLSEWAKTVDRLQQATEREIHVALSGSAKTAEADKRSAENAAKELFKVLNSPNGKHLIAAWQVSNSARSEDTDAFLEEHIGKKDEADKLPVKRLIGSNRVRLLAECFPDLSALAEAGEPALFECFQREKAIAKSVVAFFSSHEGHRVVEELKEVGVVLTENTARVAHGPLAGQVWVVTGKLEHYSRDEAHALIKDLGGKIGDRVTKSTTRVLVGTDAGGKKDDARELGVSTVTEEEFLAEYGIVPPPKKEKGLFD